MNIPAELAYLLRQLSQFVRPTDMPQRIELCKLMLSLMERDEQPRLWAALHGELGNSLIQNPFGDRAENLEQALEHYQQTLNIYTHAEFPTDWAATQHNLAATYAQRIRGERADNIERAIHHYEQALEIRTYQSFPSEWADTQNNLAAAYFERVRGERAANIERAIEHFHQALKIRTHQDLPIDWAATQNNLATAYRERIQGDRAENIEQSIYYYQQALEVYSYDDFAEDWAMTQSNLANAYWQRIRGERAENMERAIYHYHQALKVRTQQTFPVDWAATQNNLATAYSDRIRGDRSENLEKAIAHYQEALKARTLQALPIDWAATLNNLALAYVERIQGERAENIDLAILHFQQALEVRTQVELPVEWAITQNNLGTAYWQRILGNREENTEQAIFHYQQATQVFSRQAFPEQWATTQNNLATAFRDRIHGERTWNITQAIYCYQQALTIQTVDTFPADHRQVQRNLGNLYIGEQQWSKAVEAFQGALHAGELLYITAATPEARQAELREIINIPSALAYALVQQADDATTLAEAATIIERNRARWLAESLALRSTKPSGIPDTIWHSFTEIAAQIQQLQMEAQLPDNTPSKHDFLTLAVLLAEARTKLSSLIEQVRAYSPNFMPIPHFDDIQSAFFTNDNSQSETGIYLFTTVHGGVAFIIHFDRIMLLWLNALTDEVLTTMLNNWLKAYEAFLHHHTSEARTNWLNQIDVAMRRLWDIAIGPLAAALNKLDQDGRSKFQSRVVTLIPTGLLALLPLHAAWTEDVTTPTGRHYFIDDYVVRYAPSATALHHCRERANGVSVEHLLALDEPKPIMGAGPLPNSAREVKAIASLFPAPTVLQHEQASRETTLEKLAAAQIAHFSCHGTNNWQNPLDSGLLLANDELLTMRDFLELHLPGVRLATLSACETGIVGTDLPDEVIMLPSALVQAGYAGVVASLWSVADVSTAMLMVRFYQYWREEGLEPVYALRAAQRWVRDTTNKEKADYFGQFVPGLGTRMADTVAAEFFSAAMLAEEGPEARSFAHPFWWGAFYLTGV